RSVREDDKWMATPTDVGVAQPEEVRRAGPVHGGVPNDGREHAGLAGGHRHLRERERRHADGLRLRGGRRRPRQHEDDDGADASDQGRAPVTTATCADNGRSRDDVPTSTVYPTGSTSKAPVATFQNARSDAGTSNGTVFVSPGARCTRANAFSSR